MKRHNANYYYNYRTEATRNQHALSIFTGQERRGGSTMQRNGLPLRMINTVHWPMTDRSADHPPKMVGRRKSRRAREHGRPLAPGTVPYVRQANHV